uniref:Uncharacterized protein n=1 Tax=Oikopleura dioica TaxID=34765 RepID=Q675Y1_OIKDI|nr:hypothetical protein 003-26 [Oikopleura dioica]
MVMDEYGNVFESKPGISYYKDGFGNIYEQEIQRLDSFRILKSDSNCSSIFLMMRSRSAKVIVISSI